MLGSQRAAYDILRGKYRGHPVTVFNYRNRSGKNAEYFSFYIVSLPKSLPEITIAREGWWSQKMAQLMGGGGIEFEYQEFSRAYRVCCKKERYANDVCNMAMMQYLLKHYDLNVEIERTALAIGFDKAFRLEDVQPNLDRLIELRERLPAYLFTDGESDEIPEPESERFDVRERGENW